MSEHDFILRSERLVYKAFDGSNEMRDKVVDIMMKNPETFAQTNGNRLSRPLTVDEARKNMPPPEAMLLYCAVCLPPQTEGEEPQVIGVVALHGADNNTRHHRSSMLAIAIGKEYHGKGYGSEAINWALDWGFRVAGQHSIRLSVFSFNTRAIELYENLGFKQDGVMREAHYYNLQWHDNVLFSMLDREWAELRGFKLAH